MYGGSVRILIKEYGMEIIAIVGIGIAIIAQIAVVLSLFNKKDVERVRVKSKRTVRYHD